MAAKDNSLKIGVNDVQANIQWCVGFCTRFVQAYLKAVHAILWLPRLPLFALKQAELDKSVAGYLSQTEDYRPHQ
ncbi:hypothetical protein NG99_18390 [Erwinia typographi]|uniref:Uncharacterized protein n=1 Tax=Erwinia typographi TaxID=371042 RepID=A0A0A3YUR5_9GAMM|nr:hypothetical protein NG99_18390 [Erwinia typographi]